jgi:eukaryotic-like serine/threonine-protein kinase
VPNERRDTLFEQALALPPREREALLGRACADDAALRAEVASLLAAHDAAEGFFESLARDAAQPLQESLGLLESGADDNPLSIGDTVAFYRVDARLGRGGMGVVYRATDVRLGRSVALKVLPVSRAADARARARLLDEARAAAALEHPHIGTILDVGTLEGGLSADRMYMAMTLYEGETLADRLARGPVPVAESLRIGRQLASALAAAHEAGLVHRDVKPSNVLLTRAGDVRLVDFGIAARVGVELPHTTAARGTRRYMSPERASGAPPDPRADVWSLGLVLRDLLDARPEPSATPLPESLATLLHRCLDPDPARRPAHAGEVLVALEVSNAEPGAAPAESRSTTSMAPSAACRPPARRRYPHRTRRHRPLRPASAARSCWRPSGSRSCCWAGSCAPATAPPLLPLSATSRPTG